MPTISDLIARRLHEAGCRHAFGIPGGEVLALMDALERAGLRFVLTRHENAAGFMAEGTHHATGAPGVLMATLGPGVANAVNVVANALQDQVPLIFLTGCVDDIEAATYTHQVFDHRALLGPVTKASFRLSPGTAAVLVDKALAIATDDPPGPVHLDLPISVAQAEIRIDPAPQRPRPSPVAPAPGPSLDQARRALAHAEQPLMIAGMGVLHHGAEAAVAALCRAREMPLITTYKAKGILPEDDPLALGGAGLSPVADRVLLPLLAASDCILLAGYDPIEMRVGWRDPWPEGATVIELSDRPNTHYMHRASLAFACDVGAGLAALGDGLEPGPPAWPGGEPAEARTALREAYAPDEDWGPAAIVETVRSALPPEAVATVDSGAHRILLSHLWRCPAPRTLLQSTGLCTMGCALPLAMGQALASGRPVVAFTGDAGLEMVLGEFATLRDLGLPVVVIVFVDRSLALIELKQRKSGLQNLGVDFEATDFAAVAAALGGTGATVASRTELDAAVREALKRPSFTVIACQIGRRAYDGRI